MSLLRVLFSALVGGMWPLTLKSLQLRGEGMLAGDVDLCVCVCACMHTCVCLPVFVGMVVVGVGIGFSLPQTHLNFLPEILQEDNQVFLMFMCVVYFTSRKS